jgi:hypothetical protein
MALNIKNKIHLLIFSLMLMPSFGQVGSPGLSHYVLAEFTGGDILMKNGQQVKAWLNYNSLSEQMIFDENGKKLAITENQLKLIDTIYLNNRKFCRIDNTFLELLYHSKNNLYAEYKCRLEAPGTTNGYGGNSQTSSNSSFSSIEERGIQYELSLPAGYKAKPYTIYWLKRNGKMSSFKNINQLMKLYSDKKALFKSFKKNHELDYNNQESIIELIKYLEAN